MTFPLRSTLTLLALAAACAAAPAHATPAKKELVARILKAQQPGIEAMARDIARQPASELLAGATDYLQSQVPADKREAIARGLQQDADKYMNETYPVVRDRALKLAPLAVGTVLEDKFSEEELRQVVALLESPAYLKFQSFGGDMQRELLARLVPEVRPHVGPKLRALDEAFARRLGVPAAAATTAPAAAPKASGRR